MRKIKLLKRVSRCRTVITHLIVSWLLTNMALAFVLYMSCTKVEVIASMALFTLGLKVMQYDLWKIRHDKYKKQQVVKG